MEAGMTVAGAHDFVLVSLSFLTAVLASFTALDLSARVRHSSGWAWLGWVAATAVALGGGTWSMHFVAMLAFSMPGMEVSYDLELTILSLILPIVITGAGFLFLDHKGASPALVAGTGAVVGTGIVAMHYTGMAAMQMSADLSYDALWVAVSVLIAIGASVVALWIASRNIGLLQRVLAAGVMGLAIAGMHHAAMQAAIFTASGTVDQAQGQASIGQTSLALAVSGVTLVLLSVGIAAAAYDRRVRALVEREQAARRESSLAEAYRKSEERLRLTLENMDQGILMFDEAGKINVFNARAAEFLGVPTEFLAGGPSFQQLIQYEIDRVDIDKAEKHKRNLVENERKATEQAVYEWDRSDGAVLEVRTANLSNGGAIRTYTDVTARKKAEAALKQSEARYRLLAENSSDMIAQTTLNGIRTYLSPASRDIIGYDPEELIGSHLTDIVHPDDAPAVRAGVEALLSDPSQQQVTTTYRLRHKEGHWVWIELNRRLIHDQEGTPAGFVSIGRNITERMKLEERLRQSQKMEAVGQLTGGIAHDFNNLLTVIVGNAELLVEQVADPHLRELAQMMLEAAEKGADLTQHLLSFGRRQTLRPERLNIDQVVRGMEPLYRRTIRADIEIRTELPEGGLAALTDRALMESAVLNLVVNAKDAMPQGGSLTTTTGERIAGVNDGAIPAGQPVVTVAVADTGTGMSPDVLEHVFEPFFTTKEVGKGTGLGLSMVYGFVRQAGGHVTIESTEGEGTTVTIILPAIDREVQSSAADEGKLFLMNAGGERILLVEDEPRVRHLACSQLVGLGYKVEAVSTGPDALHVLQVGRQFDLLLTDVVLPQGMSGVELAREAQALRSDLRVVLTSGYAEETFQHYGRLPEEVPILLKPYRRRELAEALRRALNAKRSHPTS